MSRFCLDANIFLTAWEKSGYPINVFPSLWKQLALLKDDIILIKPIFNEIDPISPADKKIDLLKKREKYPLRMWLEDNKFIETPVSGNVESTSLDLEMQYEIQEVSKGAGQNDITLIAYAKMNNKTIVTLEGKQAQIPKEKHNYKIPLICKQQGVDCIDFVTMLSQLGIKI